MLKKEPLCEEFKIGWVLFRLDYVVLLFCWEAMCLINTSLSIAYMIDRPKLRKRKQKLAICSSNWLSITIVRMMSSLFKLTYFLGSAKIVRCLFLFFTYCGQPSIQRVALLSTLRCSLNRELASEEVLQVLLLLDNLDGTYAECFKHLVLILVASALIRAHF